MTKTLPLSVPVSVDGITYTEFNVRRPKARDLLQAGKQSPDAEEREVILFAWVAGVPRSAIEELDLYDYRAFQELWASFTAAAPSAATGA